MKTRERSSIDFLFLPGWAIQGECYLPMLSALKTKLRISVYDYGFFPKEESDAPMRMPTLSAGCQPLVIAAHSMGSLFAFRLAAANPSVKAVILFGGFARFAASGSIPGRSADDIEAMKKHLAVTPENLLKSFYRASASPDGIRLPPPKPLNGKALMEGMELLAADDVSQLLPNFTQPCLDFVSSNDLIVDEPMSGALASLLPDMRVERFQGVGHLLPITRPKEVASKIDEFLAEVLAEKR
jgi:pimeloyl-[acyl-carrier protein] methyl ester esterase